MNKILLMLLLSIGFSACEDAIFATSTEGVMKDLTGFDGCRWVIELSPDSENSERLEPMNLSDFDFVPVDGMKVSVKYKETSGGSICMVGKLVEIKGIKEINP